MRAIRACEWEIAWCSNSLPCLKERYRGETPQMGVDTLPSRRRAEGGDLGAEEKWKQVPARHRRRCPPLPTPPSQVPLQNRFEALEIERPVAEEKVESVPRRMPRARRSTPRLRAASTKKDRRVIVVGDSILREQRALFVGLTLPVGKSAASLGPGSGTLPRKPSAWYGPLTTTRYWSFRLVAMK